MAKKGKTEEPIDIIRIDQEAVTLNVIGRTPLLNHRLSEKARKELLLPAKKKNAAAKQAIAKHDVLQEFRDSPYTLETGATLIALPSVMFKAAMCSAAIDLPGATKAQLGRLTYAAGDKLEVYGIPKLHMCPVRNSGMNRTPDIRTRAIIAEWCTTVTILYAIPMIDRNTIVNLFQAAGLICGVGDWRPQKGSGNFGTFEICDDKDPRFLKIKEHGGRDAQVAAMKRADPYDAESEELLTWFVDEADKRDLKIAK